MVLCVSKYKKMKAKLKIKFILFMLPLTGCMAHVLPCFGQDAFICEGIIEESHTNKGLSNVCIYVDNDTVAIKSNKDGTFRITVRKNSCIRFRKVGYTWKNQEITSDDTKKIVMSPSSHNDISAQFDEVEVDGKFLPKEEWDDINPEYIRDVGVLELDNKKVRLSIKTK
jgi:hypothetical protein